MSIVHVYREANRVADRLAKLAHDLEYGVHMFVEPLDICVQSLSADLLGSFGLALSWCSVACSPFCKKNAIEIDG